MLFRFSCLLAVLGLIFTAELAAQPTFSDQGQTILGGVNYDARSASLADYDDDGDLDLFFQGGGTSQQLFRNNAIGTRTLNFTNVSNLLPSGLGPSWSAAWGDYNGDDRI
jgi:hypothetical protein